jgi:radical SAM superfamily enzyme with C-terminal helix-hairpin-helix motif
MKRYLILDCYVDEPACLGVPPFISPYPRYIYGALISAGVSPDKIKYLTIDHLRESDYNFTESYNHVFLIGGAAVPGKYLGARIGSLAEINKILNQNSRTEISVGGVIHRAVTSPPDNTTVISYDIEKFAYTMARGQGEDSFRTAGEIAEWGVKGAGVVKDHPWYPDVICEMETGRGCPREFHCSFCSEGLIKNVEFRKSEDILCEVDALIDSGVSRFRLGRQADIIQYGSRLDIYNNGFPRPEPSAVKELFSELKKRKDTGKILVLNVDNANPGSIVNWPDHSSAILESIADAVTPGDTLPFGIESFDEAVVRQNNLKVTPDEAVFAVKLVNEICGWRENGIPKLLPGINLIHGLKGETADTFKTNHHYLEKIVENGLLVKRINIRKLQPYPGTPLFNERFKISGTLTRRFEYFRERIRDEIDHYMLKKIYPAGTILKDVLMLDTRDGYSMGKQISSYSITVKVPGVFDNKSFKDVLVTGHRERSLSSLPLPFAINTTSAKGFEMIPGVSRDKSSDLILKRPFETVEAFTEEIKNVQPDLLKIIRDNSEI